MKLATLCYLEKGDMVLMLHRNKNKNDIHFGKWNGLGGKFLPGESPHDCAIREIREESGLTVGNLIPKGIITFPRFDGREDWYVFVFLGRKITGEIRDCSEGELKWIPRNGLLNLDLWEGDRIFLPWVWEDKFFFAKFIYKKGVLVDYSRNQPDTD